MPLPKLPTKPAALLSPQDYPKADKDKIVKSVSYTHLTLPTSDLV